MICEYKGYYPEIADTAYVAEDTVITGDVSIGEYASIWFKTVIRGDVAPVRIGNNTNVQDLSLLHQSPGMPLTLEDGVTIGHQVTLHSATIKKNALVGMGSIVLDGAVIGEEAFLGAGSLVPPGKTIPPRTLAVGRPAKVVRDLTGEDFKELDRIRKSYVEKGQYYKNIGEK
ncbi:MULTISPECIES: gamma carbonic anhydrase [Salimicrobium]|uniref:Gamma carbonic anhydrase family protein n=1 Tax=Salimicrobium humidisoli TaxID=2029857 RepID=A0ABX4HSZ6_9BACI|nr:MULTISPECIES: gamma carbonic anhydrase family protein [Salimicrobium]PBB06349.1 gamma carbonic anhydrase family protein [Salimicrobium humidisoli]